MITVMATNLVAIHHDPFALIFCWAEDGGGDSLPMPRRPSGEPMNSSLAALNVAISNTKISLRSSVVQSQLGIWTCLAFVESVWLISRA